ncbi:MAG: SDR family oxidoreductase [Pseudomonadota bacterium]
MPALSRPTLLSLGHGYCARRLARDLTSEGWRILAATRDPGKMPALAAAGAEPVLWPLETAEDTLAQADHVLISVAPEDGRDPVLAALAPLLAEAASHLRWVGYLSTTGVYGDRGGAWIDETAERRSATARGQARVAAEDAWLALHAASGLPVHIFRLAGIYGPGRGPFAKVRAGTARRIVKPGQVFSRIHVDDIAGALRASLAAPRPGRAWNVNDDLPAPPQDVLAEAARLLNLPPPPEVAFEDADLSPMAASFYSESKRTSNQRLKSELGWRPLHPTYREGLRAVLDAER